MPNTFKVSEVLTIVRKKLQVSREEGLVLLAQGKHIMKNETMLTEIYEKFKDEDGFLYIVYAKENTMGNWEDYLLRSPYNIYIIN